MKKFSEHLFAIESVANTSYKHHVVSKLDGTVLASYKTKEDAHKNSHGNSVVSGSLETIGDHQYVKEGYNDNRTGFAKRRREDDEYHVPDPVTRTHKIAFNVSKDGGEKHSRTVTISNSTKSHSEAHATAKAHLQKQGYKIHEELETCPVCNKNPCWCDDSHGFVSEAAKGHTIEAHGIKGTKGTPWRKTFKSHEHLHDWAEKNDSVEVHGTRDLQKSVKEEAELDEARMTAAMKLQKAFQREQEKSERERKAGEDLMNKNKEKPVQEGLKPEHKMRPGWMLKADPELAKKVADNKKKFKSFKDTVGKKIENK